MRRPTKPSAALRARPGVDDQRRSLLLHAHAGLETRAQAERFLANVGIALRHGPHKTLPLASMYAAVCRSIPTPETESEMKRRATALTDQLIARGDAIETNAIADRVALVHASLIPALNAVVHRGTQGKTAALSVEEAAALLVERYLDGARFATTRQLAKIFTCLSADELAAAIERLGRKVEVIVEGRTHLVIRRV